MDAGEGEAAVEVLRFFPVLLMMAFGTFFAEFSLVGILVAGSAILGWDLWEKKLIFRVLGWQGEASCRLNMAFCAGQILVFSE